MEKHGRRDPWNAIVRQARKPVAKPAGPLDICVKMNMFRDAGGNAGKDLTKSG
jgi:hypothetical protein